MKRFFLVLAILFMAVCVANAELVLWYQMDSADDYNLGEDIGGSAGRLYVANNANGTLAGGMTATSGIQYDATEGAIYMDGAHPCRIYGMEDGDALFTSRTQYTFSLDAKADMDAVTGNGYSFYLKFSDGSKFKCDLSYKATGAASFTSPGGGWMSSAYHIWDTDPAYADRYVDPETWNNYTFVWDADNQYIATYVNGVEMAHQASGTAIAPDATVTEYGFGDGYGWNGPGGWYKNYAVWDEALSAADIANVYANGVPEPATIALLGLGGLALIRRRK